MDLAPGLMAPRGDNIEMSTKVQQSQETDSEGVWTKKTVKTTVVNVLAPEDYARTMEQAPAQDQLGDTPREIGTLGGAMQGEVAQFRPMGAVQFVEGETEQRSETSESQETLQDGTTVRTKTTVTQYYKPVVEVVTVTGGEERVTREEPVGTDIDTDILYLPQGVDEPVGDNLNVETDVQRSESTNPDGTFVRRITKTTKVTAIQLAEPQIVKGDIQTRTETSQSEDVLPDGTTVKTTTTVTEHFTPVFVIEGIEEQKQRDELVGTEILEDILELPAGVDDPNADNVESSTDTQQSESTNPDGTWVKKTTKKTTVKVIQLATPQGVPEPEPVEEVVEPEEAPVQKSAPPPEVKVIEGKVETRKYVDDDEETLEDGTVVKKRVTTTRHIKPIATITITAEGEDKKEEEKLIGTDIWEEVFEYAPDYDETLPQNIKHDNSVKHHEEEKEDGSWLKQTINTTKVTVIWCPIKRVVAETEPAEVKKEEVPSVEVASAEPFAIPVVKAVIEGEIKLVTDVSESEETQDDGATAKRVTKTIKHIQPITEVVEIQGIEQKREKEVLVGTEIEDDVLILPVEFDEVAPQSFEKTVNVKESEETTPEGTWLKKTIKTTQVVLTDAPAIDEQTTPIVKVIEGEIVQKTTVSESEDTLDDGTKVKTVVTQIQHVKPVTEVTEVESVEQERKAEILVGTELLEDITELPVGYDENTPQNVEKSRSVQDSQENLPDGTWLSKKVTKTSVKVLDAPLAPAAAPVLESAPIPAYVKERKEGEVVPQTSVDEFEDTLPDRTVVKTKVTTTRLVQTVTEVIVENDQERENTFERLVGTEIDEDITEIPAEYNEYIPQNIEKQRGVQESKEGHPDGSYTSKKTTKTIIRVLEEPKPVVKERREGEIVRDVDVKKSDQRLETGTIIHMKRTTTTISRPITEIIVFKGEESVEEKVEPIGTEIDEEITEMPKGYNSDVPQSIERARSVQEQKQRHADGTFTNTKTTKVTIKLLEPVVLERTEGEVVPSTSVDEFQETLPDQTLVKTKVTTTRLEKPVKEVIIFNNVEETKEKIELVGTEVDKEIEEYPIGYDESIPQNIERVQAVEEGREGNPDGSYTQTKITKTTVRILEEPKPIVLERKEGDIVRDVDVKESDDTLENGTIVHTKVTTTTLSRHVTEVVVFQGEETINEKVEPVGTEIDEEITEKPRGYNPDVPQSIEKARSVQEQKQGHGDGTYTHTKTTRVAIRLLEPVVLERIEGDVTPATDVEEFEFTKPDGTLVKNKVATTKLERQVKEVIIFNNVEETKERMELVGTEIDEDITELPVGFDESIPQNIERARAVEESKEDNPDGIYTAKKTTKTTIRLLEEPKPVVKERKEGEIVKDVKVEEFDETLENGTVVHTKVITTTHSKPVTEVIVFKGEESVEEKVEPVGTEIDKEITEMPRGYNPNVQQSLEKARSVQEQREGHGDGTWTHTKTTKVSITLLEPVVLERTEGDVTSSTNVEEFKDKLPDETVIQRKVTTTTLKKPVKELIISNNVEEVREREELVGTEIDEDITEIPPGYDESVPQNLERARAVEESKQGNPDGSYTAKKTTKTTIKLLEEPKPVVKERKEGEIIKDVKVEEFDETLENGTVVHTKITTTTHSKPVTEVIVFKGKESVEEKVEPVGTEIDKEITEMPRGYNPNVQQSLEKARSVQEQREGHGDGTWTHTKTTKVTITLLEPVVLERTEGDVTSSTNVEEFKDKLPDETVIQRKVTTTTLKKPVRELIIYNNVEEVREREELVGTEIDEDIIEIPPGYDESVPQNLERARAVEESKQGNPDGSYTAKKTTKTTIRLLEEPKPVVKERKEGDVTKDVDVKESDETQENSIKVHTKVTTTTHRRPVTEVVVFKGQESTEKKVELVGTEIDEEITEMPKGYNPDIQQSIEKARAVTEQKQGHGDGSWTNTKTTKITIRLLEPVVLEKTEGETSSSTSTETFETIKPDETKVTTTVTTTRIERPVTELIIFNNIEETKERIELVGTEIDEDILETPPSYDPNVPQNIEKARSVQEEKGKLADGSYIHKKTTRTVIRILDGPTPQKQGPVDETDIVPSDVVDAQSAPPPAKQPEVRTIVGDEETRTEEKESEESGPDGSLIKTKETTITHFQTIITVTSLNGEETSEVNEKILGTEIFTDITKMPPGYTGPEGKNIEMATATETGEETNSEGVWTKRVTTRQTIKVLSEAEVAAVDSTEPQREETECDESEETLPDGTVCRKRVLTTRTSTKVIRRVVTEVNGEVVGDVETVEDLVGDAAAPQVPVDEEILSPEDRVPAERVPPQQPISEDDITPDLQALAERAPPVPREIVPEDQTPKPQVPVGEGEIQPDIVVSPEHAPPSVDTPAAKGDVEEIEEVLPDGTVVKRRLVQTKMKKVVTRKIRRVGPDGEIIEDVVSEEVPESELLSGSSRGSSMRSSLSDIHDLTSPYTPVSPSLDMGSPYQSDSEGGVKIYTDTIEGEPQVETDVQETEETLPDGTVVKRKLIKTKQKQTIVKRVVMEGPENDMPSSEEQAKIVLEQGSMEPEMKYTDYMEGSPETSQDVQEYEETLEDGSVVKRKVITTTEQQLKTERTVIEGASEVPEFEEDELFPEASREAESRPHPVFDEPPPVDEDRISPDMQPPRPRAGPPPQKQDSEDIQVEEIQVTAKEQQQVEAAPPREAVHEDEIEPELKGRGLSGICYSILGWVV